MVFHYIILLDVCKHLILVDHFILLGVTGRVLGPIPAAFGRRQDAPLNELPPR